MDPYGPSVRHVDVFMRGDYRVPVTWMLDPLPVAWLSISPANGTLNKDHPDARLNITIDWASVPKDFNSTVLVGIRSTPARYPYFDQIQIPVLNFQAPTSFTGFPESAGYISIEAPHFSPSNTTTTDAHNETTTPISLVHIPHLGTRSTSGALALRPFLPARANPAAAKAASAIYPIYLFTPSADLTATIYINAGLDTDPDLKMEFSLTLDSQPANFTRVLGEYVENPNAGAVPPEWMDHVEDQVWTKRVRLGRVEVGEHRLVWRVNSPEVYLEKIVVDTGGKVVDSYLGPPETGRVEGRRVL